MRRIGYLNWANPRASLRVQSGSENAPAEQVIDHPPFRAINREGHRQPKAAVREKPDPFGSKTAVPNSAPRCDLGLLLAVLPVVRGENSRAVLVDLIRDSPEGLVHLLPGETDEGIRERFQQRSKNPPCPTGTG